MPAIPSVPVVSRMKVEGSGTGESGGADETLDVHVPGLPLLLSSGAKGKPPPPSTGFTDDSSPLKMKPEESST